MKKTLLNDTKLFDYIEQKGINKQRLKEILGVSHSTIYLWLKTDTHREEIIDAINKMADEMRVSPANQSEINTISGGYNTIQGRDQMIYNKEGSEIIESKNKIILLLEEKIKTLERKIAELEGRSG